MFSEGDGSLAAMDTVELLTLFASRLKQLRIARHLAARDLAAQLQHHVSSIYNIERGVHVVSVSRLPILSRALHVEELDLFTFPEHSIRHAVVDLSRRAPIEALHAAHELLRNWPHTPPTRR